MQERDLTGYGLNPPAVEWPNGARIAVSFVVNYEEGSENSILDGDPHGETVGESPSPVARGERDLGTGRNGLAFPSSGSCGPSGYAQRRHPGLFKDGQPIGEDQ